MVSAILHFMVAIIGFVGCLAIYTSWKKQQFKSDMAKRMLLVLTFFAMYHILLAMPFLLLGADKVALAYGYVGAIAFLFLTLAFVVMIVMEMLGVSDQKRNAAVIHMLVAGSLTTVVQLIELPSPYFKAGFIFWNASFFPAVLTSLSVFFVGTLFVVAVIKGWPSHLETVQKMRAIILNSGFLALAVSGLIYFPSQNLAQTLASFASGIFGAILLVVALLIKKYKASEEHNA